MNLLKNIIDNTLARWGYKIRNIDSQVGQMDVLLKSLKKRGLECNWIMDVGANRTTWSRMVKAIFPNAHFCLIEPQVEMESALIDFCEEFSGSIYKQVGAGAAPDELVLTLWDDLQGSSFLPKKETTLLASGKQRIIKIITIDSLIEPRGISIPELVKLDIQGFELEALKGASKLFGHTEVFIIEVSLFPFEDLPNLPVFSEVIEFMAKRNYVVYDFAGFLHRPYDGALGSCDICFVKKDSFLRASNRFK